MSETPEHYVTVFDHNFVLAGVALYESLRRHAQPFVLWVVGLDDEVVAALRGLALPDLRVVPLAQIETQDLLGVKPSRSRGEYCWTLTPFLPELVMRLAPDARRVTYLDADLYFFDSPAPLFAELEASGKSVLITDHAYAPRYQYRADKNGRFCVQFMVFTNSDAGLRVLHWWQARCLEWCFARHEEGRFGDQKYLDSWPTQFATEVHVLQQTQRTLAPWNVDFMSRAGRAVPVFYHFQGFRILSAGKVKLYHGYRVAPRNRWIYVEYLREIGRAASRLLQLGHPLPVMPEHAQRFRALKYLLMRIGGYLRFSALPGPGSG